MPATARLYCLPSAPGAEFALVKALGVAPGKEGAKADPVKEAALAAKLRDYRPDSHKKPAVWDDVFDCLGELAGPGPTTFRCW